MSETVRVRIAAADVWVAETDRETIGCVALRALPQVAPRACEVKRLYVRASHRGAGVGDALMTALETYAVETGYDSIYLDTFEALGAAVRFYERRGYERIPRYNENPQAMIFMRKTLPAEG